MKKKFYIFGGTFDPVHNGHLEICRAIARAKGIKRITLMPSAIPPHCDKPSAHATAAQRLEMLRIATADDKLFEISEVEMAQNRPSYTIDTVKRLREIHGQDTEITWIIGADMLDDIPNWKDADRLVREIDFLVAYRSPWEKNLTGTREKLKKRFSREVLEKLDSSLVNTPLVDISSTQVRRNVREHKSIQKLVPEGIARYVNLQDLYK